jgi:hypothetical protein
MDGVLSSSAARWRPQRVGAGGGGSVLSACLSGAIT